MKKRGQVTLFVIIGIVALVIIGLIIYINKVLTTEVPPSTEITEQIPVELQPIKEHVEQCIFQIAKEGLIKLGQHGGYIYPQNFGIISIPLLPTSSSSIEFAPDSNLTIPYWYYLKSGNGCKKNCEFASKRPPLYRKSGSRSIESQLDDYIKENLESCLNFDSFVQDITPNGEIEPITVIAEQNVNVFVKYPLKVTYENKVSEITQYETDLDINFKRIYDVATKVLYLEMDNNQKIFERITMEAVNGHAIGYDPKIPPPAGGTDFEVGSPRFWVLNEVETELQDIIMQNTPLVQIEGTERSKVYFHENDYFFDNIYSNYIISTDRISLDDLSQVKIDFMYLNWWPIYLDINPKAGALLRPDSWAIHFPVTIGINMYSFTYDLSYPVVVTLEDDDAFAGQGYEFIYAFEVNVRNNKPMNTTFEEFEAEIGPTNLFGDLRNRNSGLIEIKTQNSLNGQPIDEVPVTYVCGPDSVLLGQTILKDGVAVLETALPICHGGFLTAIKPGYYAKALPLNTRIGQSANVVLELEPIVTKSLEVKRKLIAKQSSIFTSDWVLSENSSQDLEVDEQGIVVLTKQINEGEEEFIQYVQMKGTDAEFPTIDLVTGNYSVEGFVLLFVGENRSREAVVIPERTIEYDSSPGNPFCCDEEVTVPEIRFNNTFYEGGIVLDPTTQGYFTITQEDLQKDKLVIYVATVKLADLDRAEDLQEVSNTEYYSNPAMRPVFE